MAISVDLTPIALDNTIVTRIYALRAKFVEVGRTLLRSDDRGGLEPAYKDELITSAIGIALDSDASKKFVAEWIARPRFSAWYTDVLRTWNAWAAKLTGQSDDDVSALLAVRELLMSYQGHSLSWGHAGSLTNSGSIAIGLIGGGGGGAGTSAGSSTSLATGVNIGNEVGIGVGRLAESRQGSISGSATGSLGSSSGNAETKVSGTTWTLPQQFVCCIQLIDLCLLSLQPTAQLPIAAIMDLALRGLIPEADARQRVELQGVDWNEQLRVLIGRQERPTAREIIELGTRAGWTDEQFDAELRVYGYIDRNQIDRARAVYASVPTAAEIRDYLARDLDDDNAALRYGLDGQRGKAIDAPYLRWVRANGGNLDSFNWDWRLHWDLGGISRITEAWQRLGQGNGPGDLAVTDDDFTFHLRAADVPDWWIPRLKYLAQRPIGFRQINQLVATKQLNHAEATIKWQDLGFRNEDAQALANAGDRQAAALAASQGHGFTAAEVVKLLVERAISPDEGRQWLALLYLTADEMDTIMMRVQTEQQAALRKTRLAATEQAFVHGSIDELAARDQLARQDYSPADADYQIATWQLRQQHHSHPASRAELVQWLKDGLITGPQYVTRLQLLGYDANDAAASLAAIVVGLRAAQAKQVAAQVKQAQSAAVKQATALARARSAAAKAAFHLSRLRAGQINAAQHLAFVESQAAQILEVKNMLAEEKTGPDKRKAEAALARAIRTGVAVETEAERQRLLLAEGAAPLP